MSLTTVFVRCPRLGDGQPWLSLWLTCYRLRVVRRQCYIVRKKKGLLKAFPEYKLYLQQGGSGQVDKFLLSGRKRKKQKVSNYLISLDEEDMAKASGNYYGKVKSNFVGTEFSFFDKGSKPAEVEQTGAGLANPRKELGVVMYDTNVLGGSLSSPAPPACHR